MESFYVHSSTHYWQGFESSNNSNALNEISLITNYETERFYRACSMGQVLLQCGTGMNMLCRCCILDKEWYLTCCSYTISLLSDISVYWCLVVGNIWICLHSEGDFFIFLEGRHSILLFPISSIDLFEVILLSSW